MQQGIELAQMAPWISMIATIGLGGMAWGSMRQTLRGQGTRLDSMAEALSKMRSELHEWSTAQSVGERGVEDLERRVSKVESRLDRWSDANNPTRQTNA